MQLACAAPASLAVARPLASKAAAHRPLRPLLPGALPRRGAVLRVAAIKARGGQRTAWPAARRSPALSGPPRRGLPPTCLPALCTVRCPHTHHAPGCYVAFAGRGEGGQGLQGEPHRAGLHPPPVSARCAPSSPAVRRLPPLPPPIGALSAAACCSPRAGLTPPACRPGCLPGGGAACRRSRPPPHRLSLPAPPSPPSPLLLSRRMMQGARDRARGGPGLCVQHRGRGEERGLSRALGPTRAPRGAAAPARAAADAPFAGLPPAPASEPAPAPCPPAAADGRGPHRAAAL